MTFIQKCHVLWLYSQDTSGHSLLVQEDVNGLYSPSNQPRALSMLDKYFTTEIQLQPFSLGFDGLYQPSEHTGPLLGAELVSQPLS